MMRTYKYWCVALLVVCLVCLSQGGYAEPQGEFDLTPYTQIADIQHPITTLAEAIRQRFLPLTAYSYPLRTRQSYWLRINIPQEALPAPVLFLGIWTEAEVYVHTAQGWECLRGGHYTALGARQYYDENHYFHLYKATPDTATIYVRLRQSIAFYLPRQIEVKGYTRAQVQAWREATVWYQGIFIGIIWAMAVYNLLVYLAVRDLGWLYYVFSLFGLGFYFQFYYGFTLAYWGNYPVWNAYSFALIVPLTRMIWLRFTQTYLHLRETLPFWHRFMNVLWWLYTPPIFTGLAGVLWDIDLSLFTVNWIGMMGVAVMSMMLATSVMAVRRGYQPAWYFLLANLMFSIGSILFIMREIGFLPDSTITRYSVQLGAVIQSVLFSLGLAQRYNAARHQLAQQALEKEVLAREKEIEKKQLIEQQKKDLEQEVSHQTADLREKTEELQTMLHKLQESEHSLRELNQLKDKFFSIISHDLRSPLATLNSFLNIIANFSDRLSPAEIQKLIDKTRLSVSGLSDLIDKLLLWARVQMNQTQFHPQAFVLSELAHEVAALLVVPAEEKQIDLEIGLAPEMCIFADRDMMGFVLRNLLVNALKFTDKAGRITITATEVSGGIAISVQDTGVGIAPDLLSKLFTYQHHFTTRGTRNEQGTGLGLLLCKEFVEKHKGNIAVSSVLGEGTCFTVWLPLDTPLEE